MKKAFELKPLLEGFYRLQVRNKETGEVVRETGWFPNLITDIGLNQIGVGGIANRCQVGSGSTAPNKLDTALQNRVASTTDVRSWNQTAQSAAPFYYGLQVTFRFAEGVAAGNLSEVAVAWQDSGSIFSRALILDANGDPTTITVLSNEFLDVSYELRVYPPTVDTVQNLTVGTVATVVTGRAAQINEAVGSMAARFFQSGLTHNRNTDFSQFYDGDIGSITQRPAGSPNGPDSENASTYVNNSLKREFVYPSGLDTSNFANGIRSLYTTTSMGRFQFQFEPRIAKDNTKRLSVPVVYTWGRRS